MEKNFKLTNRQYKIWSRLMMLGKKIFNCHQLAERSFHYHGVQFPICARCTGIFLGFTILGPLMTIIGFEDMILSLYLIILMVADGSMQLYTNYISNNFTRLITGLGFGYASFSILIFVIKIFINIF